MINIQDAQIYKEYSKEGIEHWGLFGLEKNPPYCSTDNGILFGATYLSLLGEFDRKVESVWFLNNLEEVKIEPGLYHKHPRATQWNSHDNIVGAVVGLELIGRKDIIQEIYDYGKKSWYSKLSFNNILVWNTNKPGTWDSRAWLSRAPGVTALFKVTLGANLWLNPIALLHAIIGYNINMKEDRDNTSGRCLLYLQSQVLYGHNWALDKVIDKWRKKMNELYPDAGPAEMYSIYFGKSHIFTLNAPTRF